MQGDSDTCLLFRHSSNSSSCSRVLTLYLRNLQTMTTFPDQRVVAGCGASYLQGLRWRGRDDDGLVGCRVLSLVYVVYINWDIFS